jgi:hypothetical protein
MRNLGTELEVGFTLRAAGLNLRPRACSQRPKSAMNDYVLSESSRRACGCPFELILVTA